MDRTDQDRAEPQYRIAWRSKVTGWTSGGVPCMSKADAEAERDRLKIQWPMLDHWIEVGV